MDKDMGRYRMDFDHKRISKGCKPLNFHHFLSLIIIAYALLMRHDTCLHENGHRVKDNHQREITVKQVHAFTIKYALKRY